MRCVKTMLTAHVIAQQAGAGSIDN